MRWPATLLIAALAGAVAQAKPGPSVQDAESFSFAYVTGRSGAAASCGRPRCPAYTVMVNADGSARFEGMDTHVRQRKFTLTPEETHRLLARLAPFRPAQSQSIEQGDPACTSPPPPEVGVVPRMSATWKSDERVDRLSLDLTCNREGQLEIGRVLGMVQRILIEFVPLHAFVDGAETVDIAPTN